ncbi:MAG: thioredoxin family protein [Armatimonadota bacterium]|nr:thioredoxin family protein [Armatimonadota bacterium]
MITVEVFGPGCHRCHAAMTAVRQALAMLGLKATVIHISDPREMARNRILFTPVVRVNGEVKCAGRVPKVGEVATWLAAAATAEDAQAQAAPSGAAAPDTPAP